MLSSLAFTVNVPLLHLYIHKDTDDLDSTINQLDFTDTYETLQPTTHSSHVDLKHSPGKAILGNKTTPDTFQMIEIIQSIFSDHIRIKLEINNEQKFMRITRMTGS